ncbi:MAG: hypothetical protein ACLGH6_03800, partial [Gammaproteobacteria bacterium]
MIEIGIYTLLVLLEAGLLLVVLAGVAVYQWRRARRELAEAQAALRDAPPTVRTEVVEQTPAAAEPPRDYADHLAEALERSSRMLDAAPDAAESGQAAHQMLAARHQFLQLELDTQELTHDPEAQRAQLVAGMQALLGGLDTHAREVPQQDGDATESQRAAPSSRSEEHKLRDQIEHLRSVIGNQHEVMRELRRLIEEHGADSDELHEALRKLSDVEAHGLELQRYLAAMEQENLQLRHAAAKGAAAPGTSPDAEMLRDLVGSQQRTISKLQGMLQSLSSDPDKSRELEEAIGKIQRANNELNSCVMVLEDENSMLRGRIETLE